MQVEYDLQAEYDHDKLLFQRLENWLLAIIGDPNSQSHMKKYAQYFWDLGLQTVESIKEFLWYDELLEFPWMSPFHKHLFLSNVELQYCSADALLNEIEYVYRGSY